MTTTRHMLRGAAITLALAGGVPSGAFAQGNGASQSGAGMGGTGMRSTARAAATTAMRHVRQHGPGTRSSVERASPVLGGSPLGSGGNTGSSGSGAGGAGGGCRITRSRRVATDRRAGRDRVRHDSSVQARCSVRKPP